MAFIVRSNASGSIRSIEGWSDDARAAITSSPDYFVWWYTVKSVGLGVVAAVAAYYIGKDVARSVARRR